MLLLGASMVLLLPAIVGVAVLAGNTEFTAGGVLQDVGPLTTALLLVLFAFGIGKGRVDADAFLAARGDGGADAGERAVARRGGGEGGRVLAAEGDRLHLRDRHAQRIRRRRMAAVGCGRDHPDRLLHRAPAGQFEATARLLDRVSALLCDPRRRDPDADLGHRRRAAHRGACALQDHALLRRRQHLHRRATKRRSVSSTASVGRCPGP